MWTNTIHSDKRLIFVEPVNCPLIDRLVAALLELLQHLSSDRMMGKSCFIHRLVKPLFGDLRLPTPLNKKITENFLMVNLLLSDRLVRPIWIIKYSFIKSERSAGKGG